MSRTSRKNNSYSHPIILRRKRGVGHFFKVNVEELANVNKQYKIKDEMSAEYEAWTRLDTYKKERKILWKGTFWNL